MISRAVLNKMYDMIDVLLLLGIDINEISTIDMTPLSIASQIGDIDLVKQLVEKGAAINKVDSKNKNAIDYANENGHIEIVELLESYYINESETLYDLNVITRKMK
jgi:ankyrin repeat protein